MKTRWWVYRSLIGLSSFVLVTALLSSSPGALKGRITDPAGQPLPDVKITLSGTAEGRTYTMTSDWNGRYSRKEIPPSEYHVKLEKEGYQPQETTLTIPSGKTFVLDATMALQLRRPAPPEWQEKSQKANDLYEHQKYREALALYEEILARHPDLALIHFDAGNCLYHLQEYEAAAKSFREATRLKSDFAEAYTNLANSYAMLKKYDTAIPILENALRLSPGTSGLFLSLGRLYLNTGQGAKAAYYLEKAAEFNQKNAAAYHSLGLAYTQTKEYSRAIENYEKYIGLITDTKEIDRVKAIVERLRTLVKK